MSAPNQHAEQIFAAALELADVSTRRAYVERSCAGQIPPSCTRVGGDISRNARGWSGFGPASEPAGTPGTAVGDGYYLMLAPLSRGQHAIHYGGTFHFEAGEISEDPLDFPKDIRFDLTVG